MALLPAPLAHADDDPAADAATTAPAAPAAGPVPNVIITNFTYGDAPAAVGGDFTLGYTFQNMGRVAVQNMVVTVDGGDSVSIAGGTNTFYVDWLDAGYSLTQSVPMQALGSAASGAHAVTVGFRYEYVDAGVRSSGSSEIGSRCRWSSPTVSEIQRPRAARIDVRRRGSHRDDGLRE